MAKRTRAVDTLTATGAVEEHEPMDYPPACCNPGGHKFECTGTAYGGDDERWHGEGRCLCVYCGADGDA